MRDLSVIKNWPDLDGSVCDQIAPVLERENQTAEDRWQTEFVSNASSAAGLIIVYAAMNSAGIWSCVSKVINSWAVGIFFVPSEGICELLDNNNRFVSLERGPLHRRLAHHEYWQHSWMQTNVKQISIHIGKHRELENGLPKAEVHLDIYNGFFKGFNLALTARHLIAEVVRKRIYPIDFFIKRLEADGISVPSFTNDLL